LNYVSPLPGAIETNPEAKNWGMLCHLSALSQYLGIPFGHIFGPLVCWYAKKDQYPFVDDQGKESLNFQITMTIAAIVSALLLCLGIGFILLIVVGLVDLIFIIIASVSAGSGKAYRYPMTIRLIK